MQESLSTLFKVFTQIVQSCVKMAYEWIKESQRVKEASLVQDNQQVLVKEDKLMGLERKE